MSVNKSVKSGGVKNSKKAKKTNKNSFLKNLFTFLGVIVLGGICVYLMYYFFVEKSNLKINMSTDKKLEYITVNEEDELIATQKYVSDLEYSMRYDIDEFKVFKYKEQDIFKCLKNENVLVVVQKSGLPSHCSSVETENGYNNCYVKTDDFTEEYYISANGRTYRVMIKNPNSQDQKTNLLTEYMLNSFSMQF